MRRAAAWRLAEVAGLAMVLPAALARAQAPARAQAAPRGVTIVAARADTVLTDSSSALTAAFKVRNTSGDSATVAPALTLPRGWTPLAHPTSVRIAPREDELWLVGVQAPATAAAGLYVVHATLAAGSAGDSVLVRIPARRQLEILPLDAPGWIVGGANYESRYLVRNRGNVPANVAFTATSTFGARCTISTPLVSLAPGASANITVKVASSSVGGRAQDDIIELTAEDQNNREGRITASSRTTLVPKSGALGDNVATIPAELSLRAGQQGMGISPAAISGSGVLPGTETAIEFAAHAPTSGFSPWAEREDYRLAIHNQQFGLKLGDGTYSLTQLTSMPSLSFGGQFDLTHGAFGTSAYVEHSRLDPSSPTEAGAYVGMARTLPAYFGLTTVVRDQPGGQGAGIASLSGEARVGATTRLSLEAAASDSNGMQGLAEQSRVSGTVSRLSYDATTVVATSSFAGGQRNTEGADVSLSTPIWRSVSAHANGGSHTNGLVAPTNATPTDRYSNGTAGLSFGGWGSLDYSFTARKDNADSLTFDGDEHELRAGTAIPLGPFSLSASVVRGIATERVSDSTRDYFSFDGSLRVALPANSSLSFFGSHMDGRSLGAGGRPFTTGGVVAMIALPPHVQFSLTSTVIAMQNPLAFLDSVRTLEYGQLDARLDYHLRSGSTIGLRGHLWLNPKAQGATTGNALYAEVRVPLRLPVGHERRIGRVEGRVSDANGNPLSGALVHVGDQAAVTDRQGRVSFTGLASGAYHVSLEESGGASQAMLVGDASVLVDGKSERPATFALGVARGAHLRGSIHRFDFASTIGAKSDSLVEAGVLQNVVIALVGARDTVYQTTNDRGQVDFGTVAPGRWTLAVMPGAELPERYALKTQRIDVQLAPNDTRSVEFAVVPEHRTVTFISGGDAQTLKVKNQQQ